MLIHLPLSTDVCNMIDLHTPKRCLFKSLLRVALILLFAQTANASDASWKVGLARVKITPSQPVVLLGYTNRVGPFESVAEDIWAKAIALEDVSGNRAVIVSMDLVGIQAVIGDLVCDRIREKTGLARSRILLNASHSHTSPLVSLDPRRESNAGHPPLSPSDRESTIAYTRELQRKLVDVVLSAVANLEPARLKWSHCEVGFPMNRRTILADRVAMSPNPKGTVDRTVPVLRVESPNGKVRAVLFGCACHNTTLTDAHNLIAGDFAGFAQSYIEQQHPSAQAMFISGCGADANPHPRGTMEMAKIHGRVLGVEVCQVMERPLETIDSLLVIEYAMVELPLKKLSRDEIEKCTTLRSAEASMARQMLNVLDRGGELPTSYPAPFAVWRFGDDLTLVALPAEPVADYVALLREALGPRNLWIAGYNNDCFGYLPSTRILNEGGHEAIGITLWIWGQNLSSQIGFFSPDVQNVVVDSVRRLAERCGRKTPKLRPSSNDRDPR